MTAEKIKIRKMVGELDVRHDSLISVKNRIDLLISHYGEDAQIDTYNLPYDDETYLGVYAMELETDEEFKERLAHEMSKAEMTEKHEREQLAKLQAKYGAQQ